MAFSWTGDGLWNPAASSPASTGSDSSSDPKSEGPPGTRTSRVRNRPSTSTGVSAVAAILWEVSNKQRVAPYKTHRLPAPRRRTGRTPHSPSPRSQRAPGPLIGCRERVGSVRGEGKSGDWFSVLFPPILTVISWLFLINEAVSSRCMSQ